jgi:hypothetical protein
MASGSKSVCVLDFSTATLITELFSSRLISKWVRLPQTFKRLDREKYEKPASYYGCIRETRRPSRRKLKIPSGWIR